MGRGDRKRVRGKRRERGESSELDKKEDITLRARKKSAKALDLHVQSFFSFSCVFMMTCVKLM